jgi:L-ascorbate metabolism protein UlaG (beta-lactamase superfamily)
MRNLNEITLRWLGVAGIDLGCPGRRIVFDPYFTRVSMRGMLFSRLYSNATLIRRYLPTCDAIIITHSHFDHLMDAAEAAHQTGAVVYGSPNTCRILRAQGLPPKQVVEIHPGAVLDFYPIKVTAFAQRSHPFVAGFGMQSLPENLELPLHARDFAMDFGLSFLVECGGLRFLTEGCSNPGEPGRVDILFTSPLNPGENEVATVRTFLDNYQPRVVIPVHCDDMWFPLDAPARGQFALTGRLLPPLARFYPQRFKDLVESIPGGTKVFLPERLRVYNMGEILNDQ